MNANEEGEGSRYPITDRKTGETKFDRVESRTEKHSEEEKTNGITMDVRNGSSGGLQIPLSQQTAATVCWERFLHAYEKSLNFNRVMLFLFQTFHLVSSHLTGTPE